MYNLLAITVVFSLFASPVSGEEKTAPNKTSLAQESISWEDIGDILSRLQSEIDNKQLQDPNSKEDLDSAKESVTFLMKKWLEAVPESAPRLYADSLEADAEELKRAMQPEVSSSDRGTIVKDIAADLQIKAEHCERSTHGWAELIEVKLNTLKKGALEPGHEIWYSPRGWANVESHWRRFPRLSTPTIESLPPGLYLVWAKNSPHSLMHVGGDGKPSMQFDLTIPE